jgi:hypothetical protein
MRARLAYKLGICVGWIGGHLTVLVQWVASVSWFALWGTKMSSLLTVSFGWPLLTFSQTACIYTMARFLMARYQEEPIKHRLLSYWWIVATPVFFYALVWIFTRLA